VPLGKIYNEAWPFLVNQHGTKWRGLGDTQTEVREFIPGPNLGKMSKFMTFNSIQSRVVTGLFSVITP